MASDERTYIKVHDGIEDHPKTAALSDKAFRLLITTWGWCSRHLTDGQVPIAVWEKRGTKQARDELVAGGLVLVRPGHVVMHDYLQHQRSAAEVSERREAKRRGARLGNHRRWHVGQGVRDVGCEYCLVALPTEDRSVTDQSSEDGAISGSDRKTSPEVEVEVHKEKTPSTAPRSKDDDPSFDRFWAAFPRKVGKGQARKAWDKALKSGVDPETLITGAQRYRDNPERRREPIKFTKHPGPWLNDERWSDQLETDAPAAARGWWDN